MNQNTTRIARTIREIVALLEKHDRDEFTDNLRAAQPAFEGRIANGEPTPKQRETAADLLGLYGGTGSFSDIVLSVDGKMVMEDNRDLERLRQDLRRLLLEVSTS